MKEPSQIPKSPILTEKKSPGFTFILEVKYLNLFRVFLRRFYCYKKLESGIVYDNSCCFPYYIISSDLLR